MPERSTAMHYAVRAWAEPLERRVMLAGQHHWPMGAEMQVNTWTTEFQRLPAIAADDAGNFVVTWEDHSQEGPFNYGIYAQRFNAAGVPQGAEFHVNTHTTGRQAGPSVAMGGDGSFIIAWIGDGQAHVADVYAQRYDASGLPQGSEFLVNSYTTDAQQEPSIAMDADGDFVIAWHSRGQDGADVSIHAQRYNAAGLPQGAEFVVSSSPASNQRDPVVAMDADGDFIVAWQRYEEIGYDTFHYVYARRFDASGVPQGDEFRVNSAILGSFPRPTVAMDADGDSVVAWVGPSGVEARRVDAAGVPQGTEFTVDPLTAGGGNTTVSAAMSGDGDFVVGWSSTDDGNEDGIFARRYDAAGAPRQGSFRVNTTIDETQRLPAVVTDRGDRFIVAWQSVGQDGDSYGVYAQRYETFGSAEAARVGDRVWHDANANGIQDPGEAGIAGASVELYRDDGLPVTSTITDVAGNYQFGLLPGAGAQVRFVTPLGLIPTRDNQGGDDELDSDADRITGAVALTAGAAGTSDTSIDAGFVAPASISGVVFHDRNGDGLRNGGEEALAGFRAFLDLDGNGLLDSDEPFADTDAAGSYFIGALLDSTSPLRTVAQDLWVQPVVPSISVPPATAVAADLAVRTSAPDSVHQSQGPEFGVNSHTVGNQSDAAVAMAVDGRFVIVWTSEQQDGSLDGVYAQRFSAAGVPQASEFRVNAYTTDSQHFPDVAMDADGDFIVTWTSYGQDGSGSGVFARPFHADGTPAGMEFQVNTFTSENQELSAVAIDSAGNFVLVWVGPDSGGSGLLAVYGQRFDADGIPQGPEFRVDETADNHQSAPAVAIRPNGEFVIVWEQANPSSGEIHARRFSASGVPQSPPLLVNTFTTGQQSDASVAIDDAGNFVVAWASEHQPDDGLGIYAQRFNASGVPQGAEFRVNEYTTDNQLTPHVAMDADGDFVIAWSSFGQKGDYGGWSAYARRYNAAGIPQGGEFLVNTFTPTSQFNPRVAVDREGNFAIAWRSFDQDGSLYGVYAQRYTVAQRPSITSSDFVWQTAPQRIEFAFDEDVSLSLASDDILIENLTTQTTVPPSDIAVSWNAATNTATFTFPTLPNGGSLPDGRYRATVLAAGVFNSAGTTIAADWAVEFFFLAADANHDGRVNLQDFNRLAANFGQSGPGIDFTRGDFNYDGVVNLRDFNILASRFGMVLAAPAAVMGGSAFSDWTIRTDDDEDQSEVLR